MFVSTVTVTIKMGCLLLFRFCSMDLLLSSSSLLLLSLLLLFSFRLHGDILTLANLGWMLLVVDISGVCSYLLACLFVVKWCLRLLALLIEMCVVEFVVIVLLHCLCCFVDIAGVTVVVTGVCVTVVCSLLVVIIVCHSVF